MFVDPNSRVPVTLDGNTIYIRAKMSTAVRAAVQDEIRTKGAETVEELEMRGLGSYRLALLRHNIVAWEGPAFAGVACTRENIDRLDPDESLIEMVAEEIGRRNAPARSPDPKSLMPTGSIVDGVARSIER